MIVHCTIFGHPEPTIKWFKGKIPLNLCSIPRYTIYNHPDDLHEHTIASLVVEQPSYLDNGDFIVEVENEMGFERRTVNVQFQTEDEYHAIYFKKYLEHKENLKYHEYRPGEQRWEDIVPEVKEFVFWEPEEEKKESVKGSDDEDEDGEEEEDEEEDLGWNVPGEVVESDPEEEAPVEEGKSAVEAETAPVESAPVEAATEEQPSTKEALPEPEIPKDPSPEKAPEPVEEPEEIAAVEETTIVTSQEEEVIPEDAWLQDGAYGEETEVEEPREPYKKKEPEVEHPIILRRPKFYITDFQLRKKFYIVIKLTDIELMKGKTLRMQSVSSSIGPVTCEWRHNGRLVHAPTARKTIEFYPRKNQTILEIENTRVQDSGTYTVTIYNDYTEPLIDTCKVTITVPQPKETADQPPTFTRLLTGINHYRLIKILSNTKTN